MRHAVVGLIAPVVVVALLASVERRPLPLPPAQVSVNGLRARHSAGQTFLTWREEGVPRLGDAPTVNDVLKARAEIERSLGLRFRVYRSRARITTTRNLHPIAEIGPLSCWNTDFFGISPPATARASTYRTDESSPALADGTGVYVTNAAVAGDAYYAVTAFANGQESGVDPGNSLRDAVHETVGQGEPVLQSVDTPDSFVYVRRPTLRHYVRWEAPPNFSIEGKAFDYLVGIPSRLAKPAPVGLHLHCWGGSLREGFGWWYDAEQGAMLVASNDVPYDWWTGFHERVMTSRPPVTAEDWRTGFVRPFTQSRLLSFLDWVAVHWNVDRGRTFVAGSSMGGSGAVMLAVQHPERFAWAVAWVPVVRPYYSPVFRRAYERLYGPREFASRMEDGVLAWDHFDTVSYLRRHPDAEVPFISFANGKNDTAIGWEQALAFLRLLQQTRRPHVFRWSQGGHAERADTPGGDPRESSIALRVDRSLPAFTRCSLDDDPGDGSPERGAPAGQINRYLSWNSGAVIDKAASWEAKVQLLESAPRSTCLVDVTPRRLQAFKPRPGERFRWINTSAAGKVVQRGVQTADEWGLVTLPRVEVGKAGNWLRIERLSGAGE